MNISTIAIIPARGGSKRIPRKNIKPFADKPMIAHAIAAARDSRLFEHVVVTTDDPEIAEIARNSGAETPFVRPAELADDHTPTVPVVAHAIEACEALGWQVDTVCCIYPCVPFIRVSDLTDALALLRESGADYAFPVTEFPAAIQRALRRNPEGRMSPFHREFELTRTQDLEPAYHDAGQFYWGSRAAWLSNPRIHSNAAGLVIPGWRVVDIDTPEDWQRAEILHRSLMAPGGAGL
ncbi:MAG: pseudaminic acid cytidylyltransferase [Gammaproteobacteria bacterium RIFOXYA12_FULL_61_12]|nr:MAG: pseudaminic acid cytidylyltransferase [Gammaproteobacteria bacterium RIFOXYD12_FULL_61_37]OGT94684.1 MAG: pseudaminic acid cytidylyltransferase [Gammaproteobacteria bacterium RIFOXYA12_FULL_61_12]